MQLKITTIFKRYNGRQELCGERNLSVGNRSYAVADILYNKKLSIKTISDDDVHNGGFKTIDDFKRWWFMQGYTENTPINATHFNILRYKSYGKHYLKQKGRVIHKIKGD
jgi:hypothetical protein